MGNSDDEHAIHRKVCGNAQYALSRRPDLCYALKEFGRGLAGPTRKEYTATKRLVRYVRHTKELAMVHTTDGDGTRVVRPTPTGPPARRPGS